MKNPKEAKRYAKTLINTVGLEKAPDAIAELGVINKLMAKSKDFKSLLTNPLFTLQEREKVIKQIAGKINLSDTAAKFIVHLSESGAIVFVHEIIRMATALYLERKHRAKVVVRTPIEIGRDFEERLRSSLKKMLDRDVDIEYMMDPSILGGVLIGVGSMMYDTSLKGQLRLLKAELMK